MKEVSIGQIAAGALPRRSAPVALVDVSRGPLDSILRSMLEQLPSASELRSFRRLLAELSKRGAQYRDHEIQPSLAHE